MSELGISIYPSKSSFDEMSEYLKLAQSLGYTRLFTSMLEVADNAQETVDYFKKIISLGNDLGMKTSLDVNPSLFKALNISYDDLSPFANMGIWSLRLDEGFTGYEEAKMTQNSFGLKIELNISRGQHYIDMVNDFGANKRQLIGSHNFYPQSYTGLNLNYFIKTAKQYQSYNILTAAFIDSRSGKVGPWPVSNLMVSTEIQREMSIFSQVQLLKLTGVIDDIFIASSVVSKTDLEAVSKAFNQSMPQLPIMVNTNISETESKILLEEIHQYRGDFSDYMIRSSQPRVKYKLEQIETGDVSDIKRGDITIGNSAAGQYKGELQIALQNRPNDGSQNIVAHIKEIDHVLLDFMKPWHSFKFKNVSDD
ncbi:outer membrane protein [Streptococcus dysgalactiae subsp. equisimilis]|uniref:Outer membrane protein n=1 Tax=Streptococcus dysgalactiae subsp. equisimilis TaxID=119602 RepID=A0A9X8T1V6_STREQ|nr:MupG family TIM beta-alpha barrel fold protein [Streptococcus dysgalactiae]SUN62373.1 outer membrane protein [Streptococcus dysgalactiae subsp. equisimilis]